MRRSLRNPEPEVCDPRYPSTPHKFERKVRQTPGDPDTWQDRMVCAHCEHVLYDWGRPFKRRLIKTDNAPTICN